MNLFTKEKQTHRPREGTYAYQGEGRRQGIVREFGMDKYTLLYLKWITNKDLLYSTGNWSILCNNLNGRVLLAWGLGVQVSSQWMKLTRASLSQRQAGARETGFLGSSPWSQLTSAECRQGWRVGGLSQEMAQLVGRLEVHWDDNNVL